MSKMVVACSWDEVPHLTPEMRRDILKGIPAYQLDARTRGVPQLGSGAIYPVSEADVVVPDFVIPATWPRGYGMDVGWKATVAVWFAKNPDTGVLYAYAEYFRGQAEPVIHAQAIKARGAWIPGFIDPAARGRGQRDGHRLMTDYRDLGLKIEMAVNAVESGLLETWQLLSSGMLKFFETLNGTRIEFRIYRRDDKGHVVKEKDHFMDAIRYFVASGRDKMITIPLPRVVPQDVAPAYGSRRDGWMA